MNDIDLHPISKALAPAMKELLIETISQVIDDLADQIEKGRIIDRDRLKRTLDAAANSASGKLGRYFDPGLFKVRDLPSSINS